MDDQLAADALKPLFPQVLSPFEQKAAVRRAAGWIKAGAPKELAHQVALYRPLSQIAVTLIGQLREVGGRKPRFCAAPAFSLAVIVLIVAAIASSAG